MPEPGEPTDSDDEQFPWPHVDAARKRTRLQAQHDITEARACYQDQARRCPKCGASPQKLAWFYFESPQWTWQNLCGSAGWMTVCDACHVQVDFFWEIVN